MQSIALVLTTKFKTNMSKYTQKHKKANHKTTKLAQVKTSTKGTMDPERVARNSCNSWPLYAR